MTSKNKSIIASIIVWASLFVVVPFLFKYLLYTTVGIDYWAEYESVEPIKDSFEVGETLIFKSISEKYRPAFIEWSDVLYCELDGSNLGFVYFSNYESSSVVDPDAPTNSTSWAWREEAPQAPSTCFLRAGITIRPMDSIKKLQIVDSRKFRIE